MRQLTEHSTNVNVLFPAHASRVPGEFHDLAEIIEWSRSPAIPTSLNKSLQQLLALVSLTIVLEPALLRELRRLVPDGRCDPGLEGLVWAHDIILKRHIYGATPNPVVAAQFSDVLASMNPDTVRNARRLIYEFHQPHPEEIRLEELVRTGRDVPHPDQRLREFAEKWLSSEVAGLPDQWDTAPQFQFDRDWALRFVARFPESGIRTSPVGGLVKTLYRRASKNRPDMKPPGSMAPGDFGSEDAETSFAISHAREQLDFCLSETANDLLRLTRIRAKWRQLKVQTIPAVWDDIDQFWESGRAPDWASEWGRDEFGAWVEFSLPGSKENDAAETVTVRMRWVHAGKFLMGSPEDEEGRDDDEGPQHDVTISQGFWMFDAPVTQALWTAVMGENPSIFKGADRPVEKVSWHDCQNFIEQLNERVAGLNICLPSEAEWEFACRGGTTGPTYDEDDDRKSVAWFDENAGSETHLVRQKKPNSHGLYDMLGNVWEWCQDNAYRDYTADPQIDPLYEGNDTARRVIRGGSWNFNARHVRAAFRFWYSPGLRHYSIGFRCRVQSGELRPAEQGGEGGARLSGAAEAEPGGASETSSEARAEDSAEISSTWVNLVDRDSDTIPLPQSPLIRVISDVEEITLRKITRPSWATAMGRDRYGLWCEFDVPRHVANGSAETLQRSRTPRRRHGLVVQRLRWVPPGSYQFGSPKGEAGRWDEYEFEATTDLMEEGFWIFDTPVTQELWAAVMGENPSHFVSPTRPVEKVNWDDCQQFLERIASADIGKNLPRFDLLTEREWECACRAGTTEAMYGGPVEYIGDGNAPALNDIAVYAGNCGVEWDLEYGSELDWIDNKQYDFEKGGTRPVQLKRPNSLGLYDMLGNVYEWCDDLWHLPNEPASAYRVIRGGSWDSDARHVRAAFRYGYSPADRDDGIGFRCRVRELKAAEQKGEGGARLSGTAEAEPGGASESSSDPRAEDAVE